VTTGTPSPGNELCRRNCTDADRGSRDELSLGRCEALSCTQRFGELRVKSVSIGPILVTTPCLKLERFGVVSREWSLIVAQVPPVIMLVSSSVDASSLSFIAMRAKIPSHATGSALVCPTEVVLMSRLVMAFCCDCLGAEASRRLGFLCFASGRLCLTATGTPGTTPASAAVAQTDSTRALAATPRRVPWHKRLSCATRECGGLTRELPHRKTRTQTPITTAVITAATRPSMKAGTISIARNSKTPMLHAVSPGSTSSSPPLSRGSLSQEGAWKKQISSSSRRTADHTD